MDCSQCLCSVLCSLVRWLNQSAASTPPKKKNLKYILKPICFCAGYFPVTEYYISDSDKPTAFLLWLVTK